MCVFVCFFILFDQKSPFLCSVHFFFHPDLNAGMPRQCIYQTATHHHTVVVQCSHRNCVVMDKSPKSRKNHHGHAQTWHRPASRKYDRQLNCEKYFAFFFLIRICTHWIRCQLIIDYCCFASKCYETLLHVVSGVGILSNPAWCNSAPCTPVSGMNMQSKTKADIYALSQSQWGISFWGLCLTSEEVSSIWNELNWMELFALFTAIWLLV